MGAAYTVFGKQVPAHIYTQLSILTLGSVALGVTIPKFLPQDPAKNEAAASKPIAPAAQSKEDDFDFEKFIDLTKEETK
ncbi:ATP synthase K chain, mitochondrial, putative [Candida maltosa Xu316]|uniref:ATP synthase K chain, mitochondrial, putative n=1 Tax=Candida maltosa (strain Xu316) TaxID=1245528 RepID=M3IW67_CANMX|nr:ATP synthase K chain, mitochondrial, putative [Candida maltosa Xu316]